ncbi:MAG: efflux RND transporter periplasmic adaptor subunit [Planctomycetes bacterium]|nr:efflux RND transporter periplasmic adaptor subunit [Planctomycetota bacterium]
MFLTNLNMANEILRALAIVVASLAAGLVLYQSHAGAQVEGRTETQPSGQAEGTTYKDEPASLGDKIKRIGVIEVDERKLVQVTARTAGRIEEIYTTVGERVSKGEPLVELYIPELATAAQELLAAQGTDNEDLQRVARERLRLWGLDNDQVEEILRSGKPVSRLTIRSPLDGEVIGAKGTKGGYVKEGDALYEIADRSTVWLDAQIADSDLRFVMKGLPVIATVPVLPNREFAGEVVYVAPIFDPATRTVRVRCEIENPGQALRPGMYAVVKFDTRRQSPQPQTEKLEALLKERLDVLRQVATEATKAYREGTIPFEQVAQAHQRLFEAQLEMSDSAEERRAILEKMVGLAKDHEKLVEQLYKAGKATTVEVLAAKANRLEAEIALERAVNQEGAPSK